MESGNFGLLGDLMFKATDSLLLIVVSSFFLATAHAGVANDIPSCYAANNLTPPRSSEHELFILVDQTTQLDARLQNSVRENVGRLVVPGSGFLVASFSAFSQGRYLEVLLAGTLEAPIPTKARDDIGVKLLRNFDKCMQDQLSYGRKVAATALDRAMSGTSPDLARSDIMASLKELSGRVRESTAREKIVFVVSDMLEYSSISSFYANRNVRLLDPAKEIKTAEAAQQIGDFAGARIFVLGAGFIKENAADNSKDTGIYRDPKTLGALKQFWEQYFTRSNAQLIEFGTPALLSPVR